MFAAVKSVLKLKDDAEVARVIDDGLSWREPAEMIYSDLLQACSDVSTATDAQDIDRHVTFLKEKKREVDQIKCQLRASRNGDVRCKRKPVQFPLQASWTAEQAQKLGPVARGSGGRAPETLACVARPLVMFEVLGGPWH